MPASRRAPTVGAYQGSATAAQGACRWAPTDSSSRTTTGRRRRSPQAAAGRRRPSPSGAGAGRRLDRVLEGGQGPPLVLLHGPGEHAAMWRAGPAAAGRHPPGGRPRPARPRGLGGARTVLSTPSGVLAWLGDLIEPTCPARRPWSGRPRRRHRGPLRRRARGPGRGAGARRHPRPGPVRAGAGVRAGLARFVEDPNDGTRDGLSAVLASTWMACGADGGELGGAWLTTTSTGPGYQTLGAAQEGLDGGARDDGDPVGGAGSGRRADEPWSGAARTARCRAGWPRRPAPATDGRCR